ncbi:MAG: hypothetical protein WEE03_04515 [Chloroflexota bacterium]
MAPAHRTYVAILGHDAAASFRRAAGGQLPLDPATALRPAPGDRVAVLSVRGPLFFSEAAFVATATVVGDDGSALRLRRRVLVPERHPVALHSLPSLRVSAGWTHGALGGLRGAAVACTPRDLERIEAAVLAAAHAHGPRPKRPQHRRPRTPGRRALMAGRAAVGSRP